MRKPLIICIDDEKIVLDSLKHELKDNFRKNYELEFAESGEEALEIAEYSLESKQDIQLVISDLMMPGMKGDEVLIKLNELYPKAKKILLTGQAATENIVNVINHDCLYRFISKPWDSLDLSLTIKEAILSYKKEEKLVEERKKLESAYRKLTKLDSSKTYFLSLLSHELLTPLIGIRGNVDLIKTYTNDDDIIESCEDILISEKRLRGFSEISLLITRLTVDQYKMNITEEPIYSIIESSVGYLNHKIEKKSMNIQINHIDENYIIESDVGLITKAISLIIDNALTYPPAGTSVFIETNKNEIIIKDEGSGIPEDKFSTLFNMFESDELLTHNEGYGLGLTATKVIMDTLNGKLLVENDQDLGVKVTVII